ncbi:MAG: hypothetical protein COS99_03450 [Candidatus Omnitrophica bacterium CG07_land_8_20_14_0_80_42_15]|uniref:Glycosyltransferase 2-like domain-containing protein n=1 Tax=Candidatus Aquitaenariimonas noxiae TaxID=1974741 RepID=A0A2J0KZJ8_9BACT|nr:MAG: hypothetical protein COS99_03450 [Candidatus Omnitrophica bacterium CG07_land_8_20_14_0_80_42_15]
MRISILIITHNRGDDLKICLDSLVKQSRKADEVVIIDNGSTGGTKSVIDFFKDKLPIKYFYESTSSIPKSRNMSLREASGDILAILDDDCIVENDWTENIEFYHRKYQAVAIIQGRVIPLEASSLVGKTYIAAAEAYIERNFFAGKSQDSEVELPRIINGFISLKKEEVNRLGIYFKEEFPFFSDKEFGIRLQKIGTKVLYAPSILIYHKYKFKSFFALFVRYFRMGRIDSKLKKIYGSFEINPGLSQLYQTAAVIMADKRVRYMAKIIMVSAYVLRSISYAIGYCYQNLRHWFK